MTDNPEAVVVTQSDREAANRAVSLAKRRLAKMAGLDSLDSAFFYKAFARHRLAAEARMKGRAAEAADQVSEWHSEPARRSVATQIALRIRNLPTEE